MMSASYTSQPIRLVTYWMIVFEFNRKEQLNTMFKYLQLALVSYHATLAETEAIVYLTKMLLG